MALTKVSDALLASTTFAPTAHTHTIANVTSLQTSLDAKAPLASPSFTGNVTVAGTVDGVDVSVRDAVLTSTTNTANTANTTASAALPKSGGTISGTIEFQDHIAINDNKEIRIGSGNDLRLFHDGSNSYIKDVGIGNLKLLAAAEVQIRNAADTEQIAVFTQDGAVELYHNNIQRVLTTSSGVTLAGTCTATAFSGDGSGLSGVDPFPAGTVMIFRQTSAPTGWTKRTDHDNKALRVVSGSISSGGTHNLSSPPSTSHSHSLTDQSRTTSSGLMPGNWGSHTHTVSVPYTMNSTGPTAFSPKFIDVIVAVKD